MTASSGFRGVRGSWSNAVLMILCAGGVMENGELMLEPFVDWLFLSCVVRVAGEVDRRGTSSRNY